MQYSTHDLILHPQGTLVDLESPVTHFARGLGSMELEFYGLGFRVGAFIVVIFHGDCSGGFQGLGSLKG